MITEPADIGPAETYSGVPRPSDQRLSRQTERPWSLRRAGSGASRTGGRVRFCAANSAGVRGRCAPLSGRGADGKRTRSLLNPISYLQHHALRIPRMSGRSSFYNYHQNEDQIVCKFGDEPGTTSVFSACLHEAWPCRSLALTDLQSDTLGMQERARIAVDPQEQREPS